MNEETLQVLKMIEEGKITAEQGRKLIEAMDTGVSESAKTDAAPQKKKRILRIIVDAHNDNAEDAKVKVNVPLDIAKKLAGLASCVPQKERERLLEQGIDLDKIDLEGMIDMFLNGEIDENLVDIEAGDSHKGAKVKIYVD